EVLDRGERIELALAAIAGAKPIRQFDDSQWPGGGSENVDQDLGADPRQARRHLVDKLTPQHEKTADRIRDIRLDQPPREAGTEHAQPLAPVGRQTLRAAAADIPAGDYDID